MNLPKYLCQIFRKKCARKLHRESKLQLQKNYMLFKKIIRVEKQNGKGRNDKSRKMAMDVIKEIVYNTDL